LFVSDTITAAVNIAAVFGMLFGAKKGLIWLIKKLNGKSPEKIETIDNEIVRITYQSQTIDIPIKLLDLYKNRQVRAAVEGIVKPLKQEGFSKFVVKKEQDAQNACEIKKEEVDVFNVPDAVDETLLIVENDIVFSLVSISFKEDNKWRLNNGNSIVNVSIKDEIFLNNIKNNTIAFASGDNLICKVKVIQKSTQDGLKTEYEVLKVIKHIPAYIQQNLF